MTNTPKLGALFPFPSIKKITQERDHYRNQAAFLANEVKPLVQELRDVQRSVFLAFHEPISENESISRYVQRFIDSPEKKV